MMLVLLAAAQSVATLAPQVACTVPLVAPRARKPASLSLIIATSGAQDDPRPAPCGPDGSAGDFHYRSTFSSARTLAGEPLDTTFQARLKLRTPYISEYRLALIVERQTDGSLLVHRVAGFNGRNGIACFDRPDEWPVDWQPQAPEIRLQGQTLCVFDAAEIDPNAPKE